MKPFTAQLPRILGWVWIGIVAMLMIDLAMNGRGTSAMIASAVLLVTAGVDYVLWLRPCVAPTERGVRLVNPLRETFVPWAAFTWADVTDVLRVHAGDEVFRSWPLRESKRAHVRHNLRRAGGHGPGGAEEPDPRRMRPVELVARQLRDEAEKRKAQPVTGGGASVAAGTEPTAAEPATAWAPDAVAALAVPVLLLLAAVLLT